jgi:tyrosyl-tRNA synthetase
MTPMIPGTDGKQMSKSSGNCIFLDDKPEDMYSKLMSVNDDLIATYFELLTDMSMEEIKTLDASKPIENKNDSPTISRASFTATMVPLTGQTYYETVVQAKAAPSDTPRSQSYCWYHTSRCTSKPPSCVSNSDIKRTIGRVGVEIDGTRLTDPTKQVTSGMLKFGKNPQEN